LAKSAEIEEGTDKINGKIQRAEQMKVHTMFVIGKRDMEADAVSVRVHGKGNLGAKPRAEAIAENFAADSGTSHLMRFVLALRLEIDERLQHFLECGRVFLIARLILR